MRRLLRGVRAHTALTLAEHRAVHGPPGPAAGLIDTAERAGLRGRGGAGFPTATKLRAAASARGRPIVVANGAEGEPMSAKDRVLLSHAPHLVLDGAVAAAEAVGAREVLVAVADRRALLRVRDAIAERSDRVDVQAVAVPDHFLTGQETALLQTLAGRPPRPTLTPPLPVHRGLRGRPTLVHNVETLADLALVARGDRGPSALVTLGGCAAAPGVHEVHPGTSLHAFIDAAGGWAEPVRAVLLGGYHGTWVDPGHDGPARVAAGVIAGLPVSACPVAEVARVLAWLAAQTAGQCGPCVHGLAAIAAEIEALRAGSGSRAGLERLRRWSGQLAGRGACHHPDGATRFLASALGIFEPEIELHRRFGACETCHAPAVLAA